MMMSSQKTCTNCCV